MKRYKMVFFCMKRMCIFLCVCFCIKRMCISSIFLNFMDFSGLLWLFYELVEILLVFSSFKKKKSGSLFYTFTWLEFLPFRLVNSSSIFSTSLAWACPSHEIELDLSHQANSSINHLVQNKILAKIFMVKNAKGKFEFKILWINATIGLMAKMIVLG